MGKYFKGSINNLLRLEVRIYLQASKTVQPTSVIYTVYRVFGASVKVQNPNTFYPNKYFSMFVKQQKPKDFDCGYNLDLMIAALPRIDDEKERMKYAKRAVGLIKQSHPSWLNSTETDPAWEHFKKLADYDPAEYNITNPDK